MSHTPASLESETRHKLSGRRVLVQPGAADSDHGKAVSHATGGFITADIRPHSSIERTGFKRTVKMLLFSNHQHML